MTRWNPMNDVVSLREAMDRLFEESYVPGSRERNGGSQGFVPPADAWETDDAVTIEMAVPGVTPDSVEVTVDKGVLTIMGTVQEREQNKTWVLRERSRGRFVRRFDLNLDVNVDNAEAAVANGVLSLTLPKREEVKPRKIAVKAS